MLTARRRLVVDLVLMGLFVAGCANAPSGRTPPTATPTPTTPTAGGPSAYPPGAVETHGGVPSGAHLGRPGDVVVPPIEIVPVAEGAAPAPTSAPPPVPGASPGTARPRFELVGQAGGAYPVAAAVGSDLLIALGPRVLRVTADAYGGLEVVAESQLLAAGVRTVLVDGGHAYVGTSRGLVVLEIGPDRALRTRGTYGDSAVQHLAMARHYLVTVSVPRDGSRQVVEIVDAADPGALTPVGRVLGPEDFDVMGVAASDRYVLLAARLYGLVVLDFPDSGLPVVVPTELRIGGTEDPARGVFMVAAGDGRFAVEGGRGLTQDLYLVGPDGQGAWRMGRRLVSLAGQALSLVVRRAEVDAVVSTTDGGRRVLHFDLASGRHTSASLPPDVEGALDRSRADHAYVVLDGRLQVLVDSPARLDRPVYALLPLGAQSQGGEPRARTLDLGTPLRYVSDVDVCSGRVHVLAVSDPDGSPRRWIAHLSNGASRSTSGLDLFAFQAAEPMGQDTSAERLACHGDLMALIGTRAWEDPKVRLTIYDVSDPRRPVRLGVSEQAADHCYTAAGLPHANRCGPWKAIDLYWSDARIRADYILDGPQWFDVADPRAPRLLPDPPASVSRVPRLHSGGWWHSAAAVVRAGGYEYAVFGSDEGESLPPGGMHSALAVYDAATGTDAAPVFETPLETPYEVEAAVLELSGQRFLLASSRGPGLHVLSLADAPAATRVGHLDLPAPAMAIAVAGDRVYVAAGTMGLLVYRARLDGGR